MLVSIFYDAESKSAFNKLQRKHVQEAMLDLELEAYFKAGTMPVGTTENRISRLPESEPCFVASLAHRPVVLTQGTWHSLLCIPCGSSLSSEMAGA